MITELFAAAMWVAYATRIGLVSFKLRPVMRKIRHGLLPAVIVTATAVGGVAPLHAGAAGSAVPQTPPAAQAFRDEVSLDEAVRRAERQYRARVVRTDVQDEDGRKVYVLKLLSEDGRVITVRIDAATGRMR
jgi:hypothetical protein